MAQCTGCGAPIAAGLKFCTGCGKPVEAAAAPGGVRCPRCGAAQAPGTRFCTGCGNPLSPPLQPAMPPAMQAPVPSRGMPQGGIPHSAPASPQGPQPGAPFAPVGQPGPGAPFGMAAPAPAPRKGGVAGLLVALFLLVVLAGMGVGGYLLYKKYSAGSASTGNEGDPATGQIATGAAGNAAAPRRGTVAGEVGPVAPGTQGGTVTQPSTSGGASGGSGQGDRSATLPGGSGGVGNLRGGTVASSRAASGARTTAPPQTSEDGAGSGEAAETGPAGWGPTPEAIQNAEPQPDSMRGTIRAGMPGGTETATSGVILWSGPLRKNSLVVIDGETANIGTVRGMLPGVPVTVDTDYKDIGFAEMPSPANGWKRVSMRGKKNINVVVTLRWRTLR